jgi:deoxycytidylate deaminase
MGHLEDDLDTGLDKQRREGHSALRVERGKMTSYDPHPGVEHSLPVKARMSREFVLREITKLISTRGTCCRAQVGCVIARHGRIIVTGYNGSPPGRPHCLDVGCEVFDNHCTRTTHAEANAIAFAARYGISVEGCTLYTYGWKKGICWTCRKLALSAGIVDIVEVPLGS